ncbi:MAG: hypothetical protein K2N73_06665 [Lachnospiraceae bacterium]|nr:hypothetical protein [Lachnospiraceae bacterium]
MANQMDDEEQRVFVLSRIAVFADKVIEEENVDKIRRYLGMTKVGQLFEDEKIRAVKEATAKVTEEVTKKVTEEVTEKITEEVTEKAAEKVCIIEYMSNAMGALRQPVSKMESVMMSELCSQVNTEYIEKVF